MRVVSDLLAEHACSMGLMSVAACPQIYYYDSFCDILDCLEDYIIADLVAVMARVRAYVLNSTHSLFLPESNYFVADGD